MQLRPAHVVTLVVVVVTWRVAAHAWPSSLIATTDSLRVPLAMLGLLFVACGLGAWWRRPSRASAIFLVYALGGGIHWGGAVGAADPALELGLLFAYLSVAVLAEGALLHLALIYPSERRLPRWLQAALYAPAVLALLCAPLAGVLAKTAVGPLVSVVLTIASGYSILAVITFVIALWRADPATRREARLPLIVAGLLGGGGIATLGSAGVVLPPSEAWNLVYGVVPVCLAAALGSERRRRA